jgi:hypothetical protein
MACRYHGNQAEFISYSPSCENNPTNGNVKVAQLGYAFTAPPADYSVVAIYRCETKATYGTTAPVYYVARQSTCGGNGDHLDGLMGYVIN